MKHPLKKKLTLHRETIRILTDNEAMLVAGGGVTVDGCGTNTCVTSCLGGDCTQGCRSKMLGDTCHPETFTGIPFICAIVVEQ
jgi:hypothetical protein